MTGVSPVVITSAVKRVNHDFRPKTLRQMVIYKAKSKQIMNMLQTRFGEDCPIAMIFIEVGQ